MDDLARIKSKFKKLGITQLQFAEKCGIANATISRIFNGKQPLLPNTKEKLFKALGINQNEPILTDDICGFVEFDNCITKNQLFCRTICTN